jgi:hypothetical protein
MMKSIPNNAQKRAACMYAHRFTYNVVPLCNHLQVYYTNTMQLRALSYTYTEHTSL